MPRDPPLTYEQAVTRLRADPTQSALVEAAYLDADNVAAFERFAASPEFAATLALVKERLGGGHARLLDVGCGNGMAAAAFARAGMDVVAVNPDLSADVGLSAAERLRPLVRNGSIRTVAAIAGALPFPDGAFDVVYARQVLHHMRDLDRGVAECARVLAPDGLFLAVREHVVSDDAQLAEFLEQHPFHSDTGEECAYRVEQYEHALRAAGLRVRTLGPFESPINAHPTTEAQIDGWLRDTLSRRVGRVAASWIASLSPVRSWYRTRISRLCETPGRNYSFVGWRLD